MSPAEMNRLKLKIQCHICSAKGITRYGHWTTDDNPNGSLITLIYSSEQPSVAANLANAQSEYKEIGKENNND